MYIGKTLFAQLMDFLPWKTFHRIIDRHDGDHCAYWLDQPEGLSNASASHPIQGLRDRQDAGVPHQQLHGDGIVEHIAYDPVGETYGAEIFTAEKPKDDFSKAFAAKNHIYDYVFTDSSNERTFVEKLDTSTEVVVYAKLPKSFFIPTPVGNYNPDWAIAFHDGKVKHVYFIAETKGSMSTLDLRAIEKSKIDCARKFFAKITSDQVKYDVVDGYGKLMELVK